MVNTTSTKRTTRLSLSRFDTAIAKSLNFPEGVEIVRIFPIQVERVLDAAKLIITSESQVQLLVTENLGVPVGVEIKLSPTTLHKRARNLGADGVRFYFSEEATYTVQLIQGGEPIYEHSEVYPGELEIVLFLDGLYV